MPRRKFQGIVNWLLHTINITALETLEAISDIMAHIFPITLVDLTTK